MKIKNNILKISLVVAMVIGFNGCGSGDGNLENGGVLGGQQGTQSSDNKNSGDFGTIVNGNQNAQGVWGNVNNNNSNQNPQTIWSNVNNSNQNQQPISDGRIYDLAEYTYNYHTFSEGAFTEQVVHVYSESADGVSEDLTKKETFESFDIGKNIIEYVNDSATSKDLIYNDRIDSYEYEEGQIAPENPVVLARKAKIGDEVVRHTFPNGEVMTCQLYDHYDRFDNSDLSVGNQFIPFDYSDVLQMNCQGVGGVDLVSFIANGYGQVVSIVGSNVERKYNIVDKGTIQNFTPQQ